MPDNELAVGDRIELIHMPDDPDPLPAGTRGPVPDVVHVNDWTQYSVDWDTPQGVRKRTLNLSSPPDVAVRIDNEIATATAHAATTMAASNNLLWFFMVSSPAGCGTDLVKPRVVLFSQWVHNLRMLGGQILSFARIRGDVVQFKAWLGAGNSPLLKADLATKLFVFFQ